MITAKEARERIDMLATERGIQEKKIVEENITSAVEKCESSCYINVWISEATEKWLKSLGYEVCRTNNQRDGISIEISW